MPLYRDSRLSNIGCVFTGLQRSGLGVIEYLGVIRITLGWVIDRSFTPIAR